MVSDERGAGDNQMENQIQEIENIGPDGESNIEESPCNELDELNTLIEQIKEKYENKLQLRSDTTF